MGDGSGDLQSVWHIYVGQTIISNSTIIDIGAGIGKSKDRLRAGNNFVITQDINIARTKLVDLICDAEDIGTSTYDYVTAFDVIEHTNDADKFLYNCHRIAKSGIFITTPNRYKCPAAWHWYPTEFYSMIEKSKQDSAEFSNKYYLRIVGNEQNYIINVSKAEFLSNKTALACGIFVYRKD